MAEAGLEVVEDWILGSDWTAEAAARDSAVLLSRPERPTAVVAASGRDGHRRARESARKGGLRVPEDLSVIGIDDYVLSGVLGLTTVRQDVAAQGREAAVCSPARADRRGAGARAGRHADRARRARVDRPRARQLTVPSAARSDGLGRAGRSSSRGWRGWRPGDRPEHDTDREQHPAIWYCSPSRPVQGPTKNAQSTAPMTGRTVGATKCVRSIRSRRRTSTQTLTIVKTPSRRSAGRPTEGRDDLALRVLRHDDDEPTAMAVVKRMAAHGVCRPRCTLPRKGGRTSWRAIP